MRGKVEKCTYVASWEFGGKTNHNFVVKFEGSEDRFVHVSQDKENPKFVVGTETEYVVTEKKIKVFSGGNAFEYPKIELPKAAFGGGGFGGGGGKSYSKTPEQLRNELVGYVSGYVKDIICHRVNLGTDPESIVKVYDTLLTGMLAAASKHIH